MLVVMLHLLHLRVFAAAVCLFVYPPHPKDNLPHTGKGTQLVVIFSDDDDDGKFSLYSGVCCQAYYGLVLSS